MTEEIKPGRIDLKSRKRQRREKRAAEAPSVKRPAEVAEKRDRLATKATQSHLRITQKRKLMEKDGVPTFVVLGRTNRRPDVAQVTLPR